MRRRDVYRARFFASEIQDVSSAIGMSFVGVDVVLILDLVFPIMITYQIVKTYPQAHTSLNKLAKWLECQTCLSRGVMSE